MLQDIQGQRVLVVLVLQATQEHRVLKARLVQMVLQGTQELRDIRERKAHKERQEPPVQL